MTSSAAKRSRSLNGGKGGRRKVTLAWNGEDVNRIQNSLLSKGEHYKYIEMPLSNYANSNYDQLTAGGKTVGVSLFSGYSYNERSFLSLATVDEDVAIGNEVVLHWGEPNGGSARPPSSVTSRPRSARSCRRFRMP